MEPSPKRMPTLDEVAARAGVSRTAASRVINNAPHVSRAKREAVQRAVRELDFVPNPSAQALATRKVGAVVLALSSDEPGLFADPFFAEVIVGVSAALEQTELELILLLANTPRGRERFERLLRSRRADGVMLMALRGDDPLGRLGEEVDLPVVFGGLPLIGEPTWYVDADNRGGARLAAEHFARTGRRRPVMITGQVDARAAVAREQGFTDGLTLSGLPLLGVEPGQFTEEGGAEAMERLLRAHPDPDAVFAASDAMAIGALRTLRERGLRVPEDVAVIGFNDLASARHTSPPLTTVHQPVRALGQEMARMLVSAIEGHRPSPLILPTRLTVRESAPDLPASA
ncbi:MULTISPECIES: LacI family DNA-binding transcriptional regulator [unclassified Streptomyces]|uniref:LacI family DNA-binding transcriptional regulator n=1 Tax=unclassified Streptomyces TaxID=2593676 RepID=UPI00224FA94E|nr:MULTISPECIES: LacI family DNA-binding transcriptional regulator [unclassified Streptomyces]MCX4625232.1 LacI family transcriptional regulator [Streptomyces sp. NBC_01443]WSN53271.1 LacI family DNA-binding transcriptional regulator [Streptomyces sp. NBC_01296]WSW48848.1 LacI family transcriptional regulator [Streptomyces sp. NBC_01001]WSW57217.1 LacI family transcriptional regulator [Streptomyces sp. NBC_00998]